MDGVKVEQILADLPLPKPKCRSSVLIALFGLPGSGKTTIASYLAQKYSLILLSTDALRLKYGFSSGPETLEAMKNVSVKLLPQNYGVIFDGIHMMQASREDIRRFGIAHGVQVCFVFVTAQRDKLNLRLAERAVDPAATVKEGKFVITPEHFERIAQYLEVPYNEPDVFNVDTSSENEQSPLQLQLLLDVLDQLTEC